MMEARTEGVRSEGAQGSILRKERVQVPTIIFSMVVRTNQVPEVPPPVPQRNVQVRRQAEVQMTGQ